MPLLSYFYGRFYENVIKSTLLIIYLNAIKPMMCRHLQEYGKMPAIHTYSLYQDIIFFILSK